MVRLKQMTMKLYTEEQVRKAIASGYRLAMEFDGGLKEYQEGYMDSLTSIELPSDDEIEKRLDEQEEYSYARLQGAIWMKEQILNQNK